MLKCRPKCFPYAVPNRKNDSHQRIHTLRTQLCNAERLCQISPKANEPYAVISLEDQSLPHASMAAKAKDGGSWLCAIEACLQISTKENNSAYAVSVSDILTRKSSRCATSTRILVKCCMDERGLHIAIVSRESKTGRSAVLCGIYHVDIC